MTQRAHGACGAYPSRSCRSSEPSTAPTCSSSDVAPHSGRSRSPSRVRVVAVDQSREQLAHARRAVTEAELDARVALVLASATAVPVADASFDIVFCDHGAMSFCDPVQSVPEVARLLRPGGLLAFCATAPLLYLTYDPSRDRQTRRLRHAASAAGAGSSAPARPTTASRPASGCDSSGPTGSSPRIWSSSGRPRATTTFADFAPYRWARRWPAEQIWKVRKANGAMRNQRRR